MGFAIRKTLSLPSGGGHARGMPNSPARIKQPLPAPMKRVLDGSFPRATRSQAMRLRYRHGVSSRNPSIDHNPQTEQIKCLWVS
jgi:hypothetical protein